MPIRDRVMWGAHNPFSDPRLATLDELVKNIRQGRIPLNVKGGSVFENEKKDLPAKPRGYYKEYDVEPAEKGKDRGNLRIVLGKGFEVYLTGDHYDDFRQVIGLPS